MAKRRRRLEWGAIAVVAVLAAVFAYFNAYERVSLDLGVAVLYQVPLVALVFIVFLLGMMVMFLLGLRQDLRFRRELRARGIDLRRERRDEIPPFHERPNESSLPPPPEPTQ